jgi:nitrogen regulatory protein P-II 1
VTQVKRVEEIIRPEKVDDVKAALVSLGHAGLTVAEVKGHGIQKGITQQWRGQEYTIDLLPKVSIVAVVNDHEVEDVLAAVAAAARTDRIGDGKIFVSPVEQVVRIRTGESGTDAI